MPKKKAQAAGKRYWTLPELLEDGAIQQRLVHSIASHGGTCPMYIARLLISGIRPGEDQSNAVPFFLAKQYFALKSDVFLVIGATVTLAHGSATAAKVNIKGATKTKKAPAGGPSSGAHEHHCRLCNRSFPTQRALNEHLGTAGHRVQQAVSLLKRKGALDSDQGGVHVTPHEPATGLQVGQVVSRSIVVQNNNLHPVTLLRFSVLRRTTGITACTQHGHQPEQPLWYSIPALNTLTFTVRFKPQVLGITLDVLVLEFDGFSILKGLTFECDPDIGDAPSIAPVAPYVAKANVRYKKPSDDYEEGEPPPRTRPRWKNPPSNTRVPQWLETMVEEGRMDELEAMLKKPCHSMQSVVERLQRLLWVEELQHEVDIRQYDMEGVTMDATRGGDIRLKVPGLAENRPSVMRGDALYVRPTGTSGREYQGFVHRVEREEVLLRFSSNFHSRVFVTGLRFDVRFSISRSTFVFMQAALVQARSNAIHPATLMGAEGMSLGTTVRDSGGPSTERGFLSLVGDMFRRDRIPAQINWTTQIPINEEQKTAVRAILSGAHAPLPYLIFGPPGTGKTMTLTEAAVQLHRTDTAARLLLAAPSNTAADQLMLRLMDKGMIRICAYSRPYEDIQDPRVVNNSNWDAHESAFLLDESLLPRIVSKRVVVCTCLMSAKLHALGVSQGHFTHILIDEAGHAEEPLTLAAVAGLITNTDKARLVLAGDPKQLGPVILSPLAQKLGLATSTMERLIHQRPYARQDGAAQPWNTTYITKLINNYRSHPDLLSLPNRLFYNGELVPMASRDQTHSLLGFKSLSNPNFPIIFHAVVGKDEREASSPSWFNAIEAKIVLKYVEDLQDMRANKPAPADIGVISPYRKQVQKLRTLLTAKYGNSIKVGSVEEFQGQERRVVLVSTVRSSVDHLDFDKKHRLGFLANPKRFNVALTRAKALLIVVGNPDVLYRDSNWFDFLVHYYRNNGCTGSPMPDDVIQAARAADTGTGSTPGPSTQRSAVDELADRLTSLTMNGGGGDGGGGLHTSDVNYDRFMFSGPIQVEGGEMPRLE